MDRMTRGEAVALRRRIRAEAPDIARVEIVLWDTGAYTVHIWERYTAHDAQMFRQPAEWDTYRSRHRTSRTTEEEP